MMETVITNIILQMKEAGLVDEDDVEVYQFGLEYLFLIYIIFLSKYNNFFYIDSIKDGGNS